MAAMNFSTRNETWRRLMSNGLTYAVPRFQCDYSWGEDEWEDLWQDSLMVLRGEAQGHYLGYLVLRSEDERHFEIIDGQQRLTTLSLFVLAGLRRLQNLPGASEPGSNVGRRIEGLRQSYIGYEDPVTLVSEPKLKLNRNNDTYYRNFLVPLKHPLPKRGFKASEHRLRKAFEWFDRRLRSHVRAEEDPGRAIAELVDRMSDRLFFTVITVTDELNAYTVFETLNARGVRLSATDLLKNYLFALLHRERRHERELDAMDDRWALLVDRIGAGSVPDFVRCHWMSRHGLVRRSDLFKTVRRRVRDPQAAVALLDGLERDLDVWLALIQPDAYAEGGDSGRRRNARLLRMFSVRQPLPLLLAAHRHLAPPAFGDLLRAIVMLSFRYNVIRNRPTAEQERAYSAEAQRIERGEHRAVRAILEGLRGIYPRDDEFRSAFAAKTLSVRQSRNLRIARYLLCELERRESGSCPDHDDPSVSVEHIAPSGGGDGWEDFGEPNRDALTSRLGNLVLLEKRRNRKLGHAPYAVKRDVYRKSAFRSTRKMAEDTPEWTQATIAARQRKMAKTAAAVWRVSQLG